MRKINIINVLGLLALVVMSITSCKKDKNVYADDFVVSIEENPADSAFLGTITATTEKNFITYTLISENPAGALIVDESTGDVYVRDGSLFNYETNATITAEVEASNGKKSDVSNVTITLTDVLEIPATVGDYRDGGIVFWVDPGDNTKGLVCAVTDQAQAAWGCYDLWNPQEIAGADGTAIGDGKQNTADIVNGCPDMGIAARVCDNLVLNGYSDWFLPSRDEMLQMYVHMAVINDTATFYGGTVFDDGVYYWTSSEYSEDKAYDFYFFDGTVDNTLKLNSFVFRPVREF